MRRIVLSAAALAAAAIALPAAAQEAAPGYEPAPAYGPAPFTGLRVEGLIGYDNLSDGGDQASSSSSGVNYGAAIGYDAGLGPVVVGIDGEITGSTVDTRTNDLFYDGDQFRLDAGRDLYVGGRVGYAISDVALGYVKAGYTNARLEARYELQGESADDHVDLDGFRIGAGLEYKLGINSFIKGEYRYSNYGNAEGYDVDVDRQQLMAGVGFRF